MKVAKDWERFPIAILGRLVSVVVRLKLKEGFAAGVYPQASKARYVCAGGEKINVLVSYIRSLVDYPLNWRNDSGYVNRGSVVFFIIMA